MVVRGGHAGGVEGLAVKVIAGQRGDKAGVVNWLPDEVDGVARRGSDRIASGDETGGCWGRVNSG
jgi:hypothetical protein